MTITESMKGYEVRFPYDEEKVKIMRTIQGASWRKKGKFWYVPFFREREVEMLRQKFNIKVEVKQQVKEMVGDIPELPDLTIDLKLPRDPFPFQKKGIARGMELRGFINGDAPGLGKTTQAICTAVALDCKCILVVCPKSLRLNWQAEFLEVAGMRSMILGDKYKTSWLNYYKIGMEKVFITNYEGMQKYFVAGNWKKPKGPYKVKDIPFRECVNLFDCVIVDESHNCKDGDTIRTKIAIGVTKNKPVVQCLSGTPMVNTPYDLVPQLIMTNKLAEVVSHIPMEVDEYGRLKDRSGHDRFVARYCNGRINGASNLKELNYRLFKCAFFRREKKDVLHDLPEKTRQIIRCEITNREEYETASKKFEQYLREIKGCSSAEVATKLKGQMMVKIAMLKQISARGKLESAQEYINEVVDAGEKIVVVCNLNEIAAELMKMYPDALTMLGDDDDAERHAAKEKFQNDPSRKIIIMKEKLAVGHTLTAASEILLIEWPWTDAIMEQIIDRVHRIGQTKKVRAGIMLGYKTIDKYCYDIILKKRNIFNQVVGTKHEITDEIVDELLNLFNQHEFVVEK